VVLFTNDEKTMPVLMTLAAGDSDKLVSLPLFKRTSASETGSQLVRAQTIKAYNG
jgi:hypothetical protein